jgi:guanylate kinase
MKNKSISGRKESPMLFRLSGLSGVGKDTLGLRLFAEVADTNLKNCSNYSKRAEEYGS